MPACTIFVKNTIELFRYVWNFSPHTPRGFCRIIAGSKNATNISVLWPLKHNKVCNYWLPRYALLSPLAEVHGESEPWIWLDKEKRWLSYILDLIIWCLYFQRLRDYETASAYMLYFLVKHIYVVGAIIGYHRYSCTVSQLIPGAYYVNTNKILPEKKNGNRLWTFLVVVFLDKLVSASLLCMLWRGGVQSQVSIYSTISISSSSINIRSISM